MILGRADPSRLGPALVLLFWLCAACAAREGEVDPGAAPAVTVRDAETGETLFTLRRREVAARLARARLEMGREAPPLEPAAKRALIELAIEERLLARATKQSGVSASTTAVAAELTALEAEGEAPEQALREVYRSRDELRRAVEARLSAQALLALETVTSSPTEAELRAAFDALPPEDRRRPTRVRASQIVVETETEARELRKALEAEPREVGAEFARLARERSIAPEGELGGELGWFARGEMPEVFETCFELAPGETSRVTPSTYGYHLFRVHEVEPDHSATLEELRGELSRGIREAARAARERSYRAALKDGLTVTLHPEVLRSLGVDPEP